MKIKLSSEQLLQLKNLLEQTWQLEQPIDYDELCRWYTLLELHEKIYKKAYQINGSTALGFSPAQSAAFVSYFDTCDLSGFPYEQNLIRIIINQLDKNMVWPKTQKTNFNNLLNA
ncbi:hypothetical protein [Solitalea koreensis]|uniref:Uncharacterized protein n=1 Tax=Solitalea koreensis TaxID=543615 RepID=A0A521BMG4_9SPHI|nr:hypothetical protein [Solitalea koreensis]SMO48344.1 hypothetical protein SAMN06265350_102344 [Solitalea koreensis]